MKSLGRYPSGQVGGSNQVWNFYKPHKMVNPIGVKFIDKNITSQSEQDNRLLKNFRGKGY